MELNNLFLEQKHIDLGAKMVPFGGWNMPVQYEGIIAEHNHTREKVSLFDISHMGEFLVKGPGCAEAVATLMARPVASQKVGVCRYNFLMNDQGGVQDDLIIYRLAEDELFIVVNAACAPNDAKVIQAALPEGIEFTDISSHTGKLDLQGPLAFKVMETLGFTAEDLPGYFKSIQTEVQGIPCIVSRTGYTGELGLEFYVDSKYIAQLWDVLSAHEDVKPCGLGARDTLRLEVGYALYGHELDNETTPIDVGFGGLIKFEREYVGRDALKVAPRKFLTPIVLDKRRAAREGAVVFDKAENVIGKVTSGSFAPSVGTAIALAFLETELTEGTEVLLGKAPKYMTAKVGSLPFYTEGTVRN
ncbi:MAG: glycine cleavage system aminomethyltransferase GcvT [Lentisphaeria bacterium]|nr:glycine cleavage system aminomethyltransferase GcvT [Lentisphaeria bacterium]